MPDAPDERPLRDICDPVPARDGQVGSDDRARWFRDHYESAVGEIVDFMRGDGIELTGRDVADVGSGDGIIDLGLVHRTRPRRLVGFDVQPADPEELLRAARQHGVATELPAQLEFVKSEQTRLPAPDESFDIVVSWSAFEHIVEPVAVLREIHRVLRSEGIFMLQLWPFFFSERGSHLSHWYPDGFASLRHDPEVIEARLRADADTDPAWVQMKLASHAELNRITLDELQRALLTARLLPAKVELIASAFHIPPELNRYPLSDLAIGGVKLLASRSTF